MDTNLNGLSQTSLIRRNGQSMQVRAKFGPQKCQFNAPRGFCLGIDEEIIVADTNINSVCQEKKKDNYGVQEKLPLFDNLENLLFVIEEMREVEWKSLLQMDIFIRKISIRYIDIAAGLAITQESLPSFFFVFTINSFLKEISWRWIQFHRQCSVQVKLGILSNGLEKKRTSLILK